MKTWKLRNVANDPESLEGYCDSATIVKYVLNDMNDRHHGLYHRNKTTERGQHFADLANANGEVVCKKSVFVATMLHDVGHHIDAKNHEAVSAQICRDDKKLLGYLGQERHDLIADCIADHRASKPQTVDHPISFLLRAADRRPDPIEFLESTYTYRRGKDIFKGNYGLLVGDALAYTKNKFATNGIALEQMYFEHQGARIYIPDPDFVRVVEWIKEKTASEAAFTEAFNKMKDRYEAKQTVKNQRYKALSENLV